MFSEAKRMELFSGAVFYEMAEIAKARKSAGKPVIDLGIGSPDMPPPVILPEVLKNVLDEPGVFGYQRTEGTEAFKHEISEFLHRRYQVSVSPDEEVLVTIGAQDALAHLTLAFINPGDVVLIPDPGYPIYEVAVHLAGGIPYFLPLIEENEFLPDFKTIPHDVLKKAKMLVLNFPSNPTSAVATPEFFSEVVEFAKQQRIMVIHDAAYIELVFDGYQAPSFLRTPGAIDVGIELHSFSKTFNFAGPRLAFAAGNRQILKSLGKLKSQIDYGVFSAIQYAGAKALKNAEDFIEMNRMEYQFRRDALLSPIIESGWSVKKPLSTMFVWLKTPKNIESKQFAKNLLQETGIITVPGIGFGKEGEGYIRIALVQPADVLNQVGKSMANFILL